MTAPIEKQNEIIKEVIFKEIKSISRDEDALPELLVGETPLIIFLRNIDARYACVNIC